MTAVKRNRVNDRSGFKKCITIITFNETCNKRTRMQLNIGYKKLSYRRETARQLHTSFWARSLIVHFTEHRICFTTTIID